MDKLTKEEKEELFHPNEFMAVLGVTEMTEDQWARWKELTSKTKKD